MNNEEQLKVLYEKFLNGQCNREELTALLDHFEKTGQDTPLKELMEQHLEQNPSSERGIQERIDKIVTIADRALLKSNARYPLPEKNAHHISSDIPGEDSIPVREIRFSSGRWKRWVAAASIAAIVVAGYYTWFSPQQQTEEVSPRMASEQQIRPGGDRALLTLGDGTVIDLQAVENGRLSVPDGTIINKDNGQLTYQVPSRTGERKVVYNTITTPLGGQYEVVLPDGSHAWLNAGSSLRFPTIFTGEKRFVEITGEVYFEVTSNKAMPFVVKVPSFYPSGKDMEVTVLGTKFNIMAYAEETAVKTTLLEGVVKVSKGTSTSQLMPGMQAVVNKRNDKMNIRAADLQQVVAWKEGRFEFNGSIQEIMRQIARWYDVKVEYQGNIGNKAFIGAISRKENVQEVLKMLELTGGIRFEVENKTIRVMPPN